MLLACGGGAESTATSETAVEETSASAGEETTSESGLPYRPDPRLSVYVQGPDQADVTADIERTNTFRFEVVLTNTGRDAVGLAPTKVWFNVYRGDEQIECPELAKQTVETPAELPAGDAFTFHADAVCVLPSPGEYEVRAYLSVATDDENLDIERHYVGQYRVTRP
jgi:hypothetical protein